MCELFAMSSRRPTVATITLERFAARGGLDGRTIDGWGLALYDGPEVRLYREPEPARGSPWLQYVQGRRLPTQLLISHRVILGSAARPCRRRAWTRRLAAHG
ncbi:MAG: class II glutamine amidotransferase [Steroidobacteraceae bacterium]